MIHTLGAPLPTDTFGGGWIYGMNGDIVDIGLVIGLDYADPTTDPHDLFQQFKLLPAIRPLLEGGKLLRYGAKAIPEGGLHAMPRLYADGLCLIGDTAGFLNGMRLKGIHLAIKSGMLAAEAIFEALAAETQRRRCARRVRADVPRVVGVHRAARRAQLPRRLYERACGAGWSTPRSGCSPAAADSESTISSAATKATRGCARLASARPARDDRVDARQRAHVRQD